MRSQREFVVGVWEGLLTAFDACPSATLIIDKSGTIIFANRWAKDVLGMPAEDLIGKPVDEVGARLAHIDGSSVKSNDLPFAVALRERRQPPDVELLLTTPRGNSKKVTASAAPLLDQSGKLIGAAVSFYDTAEWKLVEQEIRDSEQRYKSLFEANPHPMWVYDLQTLRFLAVNDAAIEHYGYSREEFLSMTIADIHPPEDIPALLKNIEEVTEGLDIAGVWRHRKKDGTIIDVDIVSHTLVFGGKRAELALANDITERKQAEDALRESEGKYRTVVERANDGIVIIQDNILKYANQKAADMLGRNIEEGVGLPYDKFVHPDELEKVHDANIRRFKGEDVPPYEMAMVHKDGSRVEVEINGARITYQDKPALLIIIRDITERKHVLEALKESEERLQAVIDNSPAVIYVKDIEGRMVLVNRQYAELLGASKEQIIGKTEYELLPREAVDEYRAHDLRVLETREPLKFEEQISLEDIVRTFVSVKFPLRDSDGNIYAICGVSTDITERIQMEERLRQTTSELEAIFRALPDIYFRVDADGVIVDYKAGRMEDFFVSPEEFLGKNYADVLPHRVAEKLKKGIRHAVETEDLVTVEYSLSMPKGVQIYEARIVPFKDGQIIEIIRNITETRSATGAVERSEAKYRDLVEDISDWVWQVDREGRYTYSSPAVEKILGYKPEEVIGKSAFDLIIPEDREHSWKAFREALELGKELEALPNRNRHKNGSVRHLETKGSPVFDDKGGVIGFRGIDRDVTDRMVAEEEKRRFFKTTIWVFTDGKLDIVTPEEAGELFQAADMTAPITNPVDASAARRSVRQALQDHGLVGDRLDGFIIAAGEAISNAIKHAGGGIVSSGIHEGRVWVSIADKGPGMEHLWLPRIALEKGYSTKPSLGLGYSIILDAADKVSLSTGPEGTQVVLEKNLIPPEPPTTPIELLPDTW
ncbi:MAG: PAS domain S-box protein [Armatimonadota bacterium]|nr:PAS domain S-box protein [Armatimonadota bacterium]